MISYFEVSNHFFLLVFLIVVVEKFPNICNLLIFSIDIKASFYVLFFCQLFSLKYVYSRSLGDSFLMFCPFYFTYYYCFTFWQSYLKSKCYLSISEFSFHFAAMRFTVCPMNRIMWNGKLSSDESFFVISFIHVLNWWKLVMVWVRFFSHVTKC